MRYLGLLKTHIILYHEKENIQNKLNNIPPRSAEWLVSIVWVTMLTRCWKNLFRSALRDVPSEERPDVLLRFAITNYDFPYLRALYISSLLKVSELDIWDL